jgi:prevent-host-death family protein
MMKNPSDKNTIPLSEARQEFTDLIKDISQFHTRYFITKRGRAEAVMMSVDEYDSWRETIDILSNKAEIKALRQGEKDIRSGRVSSFKEVFGEEL